MKNWDNYTCDGQLSIWDMFKPEKPDPDDLPDLEYLVPLIEKEFDVKFSKREFEGKPEYYFKYKKSEFCIDDSTYLDDGREGKRFVGFSWNASKEGYGSPCDNLHEVIKAFRKCFERADHIAEERKKEKTVEVDIKGYCSDPYCSKCNYNLYGEEKETHCPICGAKLDWSRYLRYLKAENENNSGTA